MRRRQAAAFETVGNIYAPYYRQADAASRAAMPQAEQDQIVAGAPTEDGLAAFEYYIAHYNDGRPFILAGHSLGSKVLANLLADYMKKNPDVYRRMIAAYIIGYSITPSYLTQNPHLKFAEGPDDTGVIISYNTEAPEMVGTNPVILPGGRVINPITWTRTEKPTTATQNLGSISLNKDGSAATNAAGQIVPVKNLADAQINTAEGVLICSTVDVNEFSPRGPGELPPPARTSRRRGCIGRWSQGGWVIQRCRPH